MHTYMYMNCNLYNYSLVLFLCNHFMSLSGRCISGLSPFCCLEILTVKVTFSGVVAYKSHLLLTCSVINFLHGQSHPEF